MSIRGAQSSRTANCSGSDKRQLSGIRIAADPGDRKEQGIGVERIEGEHRHPVAGFHSQTGQDAGGACAAVFNLRP